MDESTDISDTAQLAIFVSDNFEIKELLDLCLMKGTTRGRRILAEVEYVLSMFDLPKGKRSGLVTDGAPAMTGKHMDSVAYL